MEKKRMSDKTKIAIFRWWIVGAVYFFIAMGTSLAQYTDPLDLIFFLGVGIGAVNVLIFHPIIYNMFTIKRRGKIQNRKYFERGIFANVGLALGEILKCLVITILVFLIYQGVNIILLGFTAAGEGEIVLAGEPILFSLFFTCLYCLLASLVDKVYEILEKSKENDNTKGDYEE